MVKFQLRWSSSSSWAHALALLDLLGETSPNTVVYSEQSWLEHRQKKGYPTKFKSLSVVMIPFLILLVLFVCFFPLCFPDSLISTEVLHLPKQHKVRIAAISAQHVSVFYHGSVTVANKWWCFQYSQECCGKCRKSLNQVSDGKWDRRRKILRLK